MKRRNAIVTLFLLILFASLFVVTNIVSAAPVGVISAVDQATGTSISTYAEGTYIPGETYIMVDLEISSASGILGWGVDEVKWNPTVVEFVAAEEGPYLQGNTIPKNPTLFACGTPDLALGVVSNGMGSAIIAAGATSNLDSGVLCTVYFLIVGTGNANIQFNGVSLANSPNPPIYQTIIQPAITVEGATPMATLTITSDSNRGNPTPSVGSHSYPVGTEVAASVTSPFTDTSGNEWVCSWIGTGSGLTSGSDSEVTFTITEDSSITWHWHAPTSPSPTPTGSPTPTTSPDPTDPPIPQIDLTVTSAHGNPTPIGGIHKYAAGSSVTCQIATTPVTVNGLIYNTVTENGVVYACTGWTGTGDIPPSGTTTSTGPIILTAASSITWNWITLPSSLDIQTNKGGYGWNASANAFGPQEEVTIVANLASATGTPVSQRNITFSIYLNEAQIDSQSAITNTSGIATASYRLPWSNANAESTFGIVNITSTVEVAGAMFNDSCAFKYGYLLQTTDVSITNGNVGDDGGLPRFSRSSDSTIDVKVTIANLNWSITDLDKTSFYLAGVLYDNNTVPIACQLVAAKINPIVSSNCNPSGMHSASFTLTLSVPKSAYVGEATIYVNVYTSDSTQQPSVPYCRESSIKLLIEA
jgi:hypothetical protein